MVCLGIVTAVYSGKVPDAKGDPVIKGLRLFSAILFVLGILWSLVRLFHRLFAYRPARGLIDGALCGIIAGFIGGQLGYGSYPTAHEVTFEQARDGTRFLLSTNYVDPSYLRILLALAFTVPIAALLGLGCDLIHTDRKINWRRDLGIVLLVSFVVLFLVGFGIFRYVPEMQGKGISFSNIGLLFEAFLIAFCSNMAWNFRWRVKKYIGRLSLIVMLVAGFRIVTWSMTTHDPEQRGLPLWSRQYFMAGAGGLRGQGNYDMALAVGVFCLWTVVLYAIFYSDNALTKRIERYMEKIQ